jgi:hypothetical protein
MVPAFNGTQSAQSRIHRVAVAYSHQRDRLHGSGMHGMDDANDQEDHENQSEQMPEPVDPVPGTWMGSAKKSVPRVDMARSLLPGALLHSHRWRRRRPAVAGVGLGPARTSQRWSTARRHDSALGGDADHYQPPCQAACRYHMCEAVDMAVPGGGLHD